MGIKQPVFMFDLNMTVVLHAIPETVTFTPPPRFPLTTRDITLIVKRDIEAAAILQCIADRREPLVEQIRLFDVFVGKPIADDRKSISLRITYRSAETTLKDQEVNRLHAEITGHLIETFGARLPE
jgi:phenylalanyl-tRNA synthetase beta chain